MRPSTCVRSTDARTISYNATIRCNIFRRRNFPGERLRSETPGKYETYVDLQGGAWNHVKIEVQGVKARLYVNGAEQPTLLVNDLKHGVSKGGIALWIGPSTVAHFANLKISR